VISLVRVDSCGVRAAVSVIVVGVGVLAHPASMVRATAAAVTSNRRFKVIGSSVNSMELARLGGADD
jgi:hypothetical protein